MEKKRNGKDNAKNIDLEKLNEKYVKWLSELSAKSGGIAGGKGANLAEMYNIGMPVPPAFCITAQAFEAFLISNGLKDKIKKIIQETNVFNTKELDENAKKIRDMVVSSEIPKDMQNEIIEAYNLLGSEASDKKTRGKNALEIVNKNDDVSVAVRSSATAEDLSTASFAGAQETFTNIRGKEKLIEAVKKCFASLYTPRAIYYRHKKGFEKSNVLLSAIVQRMINSEKSGVVFTRDPTTGKNEIVIESVFGLGEGIVSGKIMPDHYVLSKELEILDKKISNKKIALVREENTNGKTVKLTNEKSKSQVLTNGEIKMLGSLALKLEEHYKKPQDIEFAISEGKIYIVQTRPITTLEHENLKKKTHISGEVILTGLAASPGVAFGTVKLIIEMKDLEKVKKGDILVTKMTNPDMVVAMQKANAIVTDEGGSTCFSGDTNILTNNGFMTIQDTTALINAGEQITILGYNAKNMKPSWKKVLSVASRKRSCIRISVSQRGLIEDNAIDLTPDHKMFTFENRQIIKEEVSSILEKEKYLCILDSLPKSSLINREKLAYLLGALITDGCVRICMHHTGNPRRGIIVFTQKETEQKKEFISTVRDYFEECFRDKFQDGKIKQTCSNIGGRVIQGCASDFICHNLKASIAITQLFKNLDSFVLSLDYKSCLNLLAGLIDGDGSYDKNRLHIYASEEKTLQGIILACLKVGIFPQVTRNRNLYHVQILEKVSEILNFTKRIKAATTDKIQGNKLFAAKQIIGDIIEWVNYKGRMKPYVKNNLLLDSRKILSYVMPLAEDKVKSELYRVIDSGLRMQRIKHICNIGEIEVFNIEVEADNELDHNFVVFTKKYTPLLVSNSHAAIISREMGIPCVVGTETATEKLKEGMTVTVDGTNGRVYKGKTEIATEGKEEPKEGKKEILPIVKGTKTKIKTMVDLPDFASRAAKSQCESVGLMRLEGVIAESGKHPLCFLKSGKIDEYSKLIEKGISKVAEHFKEIWIRTSDIRTDEYQHLQGAPKEKELNPMLGFHGIRFSLKNPAILEAEMSAIYRASEKYPNKKFGIMFPQVISENEVKECYKLYHEKYAKNNIILGAMIETPAAVQVIRGICKYVKFISFGTNDLTQYTLAIDRGNEHVQYLYDELHPAILSQIKRVIDICKEYKVETSICGQAGSRKEMVEQLVRIGIDSISVNADMANEISIFVKELESKGIGTKGFKNTKDSEEGMAKKAKIIPIDDTKEIEEKIKEKKQEVDEKKLDKKLDEMDSDKSEESEEQSESEKPEDKEKKTEEFPHFELSFDPFQDQSAK